MLKKRHIILSVTGSIAAYKSCLLLRELQRLGADITPVLSRSAARFITPTTLSALAGKACVTDLFSNATSGQIPHINVAHNADLNVIAPATADCLARLATGRADEPVSAIALASTMPLIIAPAMETGMWNNPATQDNITTLTKRGAYIVPPTKGLLASGSSGMGRMADTATIINAIITALTKQDFAEKNIVVTAGPTREHLDPARFISNPSSGKMGYAIAQKAQQRGANVTLISGPTSLPAPVNVKRISVESTTQMLSACTKHISNAHLFIMAAAPADFCAATPSPHKQKKENATKRELHLKATPDILKTLHDQMRQHNIGVGAATHHPPHGPPFMVGFAAESENLIKNAKDKLNKKGLDLIVANLIGSSDTEDAPPNAFGGDTNQVTLIGKKGSPEPLPVLPKEEVASKILDRVAALYLHK